MWLFYVHFILIHSFLSPPSFLRPHHSATCFNPSAQYSLPYVHFTLGCYSPSLDKPRRVHF